MLILDVCKKVELFIVLGKHVEEKMFGETCSGKKMWGKTCWRNKF